MLKTTVSLIPAWLAYIKTNENELGINDNSSIGGGRIDNRITNLSSSTKKMSFKMGFFIYKASLAFIRLKKAFIKALILYYFDLERHIRMVTDGLSYAISEVLSQLTTKKGLASQKTYKINNQLINLLSKIRQ